MLPGKRNFKVKRTNETTGKRFFHEDNSVFIIAEVSANHGQDFKRAVQMIKTAKKCGADAVKFQAYTPDTMTMDVNTRYFQVRHAQWSGQSLYQLYQKAYTPFAWFKKLKKVADDIGILFFATAFDKTAVDLLEEIRVPVHKIASFELNDIPLIRYMARTKKPLILSTGMATLAEIQAAVDAACQNGTRDISLLKCVSDYPASPEEMNLATIPDMKKRFPAVIGLSDHSLGIGVSVAGVSLGAKIIEKHFTLSRKHRTADNFFSLEPDELKDLVDNIRVVEKAVGQIHYGLTKKEKASRIYRRSLFAVQDIRKGEKLTEHNVRSIRPAYGLDPEAIDEVLDKTASRHIRKGVPLRWDMIET